MEFLLLHSNTINHLTVGKKRRKEMSSGLFKNVINKICL